MTTAPRSNRIFFKMILLTTCFLLAMLYNQTIAEGSATLAGNSVTAVSFKNNSEKNELVIRVKSSNEAVMKLFLFSPDGILIQEAVVCRNKATVIKGLKKGYYLYECFDNDERMKSGSLIIK